MTVTRRALLTSATLMLLAFAACSPASNHNTATGNANVAKPAANAMDHGEVCSAGSPVGFHDVFEELARSAARQRHSGERAQ